MANWVSNGPCARCGSRDNLAHYDDGSCWCWGCRLYIPPKASRKPVAAIKSKDRGVYLPEDSEPYYPLKCLEWAKQYDLSDNDLRANQVVWSDSKSLLIFPYRSDDGSLLAWQGRNFGNVYSVKWFGRGNLEDVFTFKGPSSMDLVLTEDVVSAIKVGKAGYRASPIFGSNISVRRLKRLKLLVDKLTIWLDSDKIKEAHKACLQAQLLGFDARTIYTELDPKCYSLEAIDTILHPCYNINSPVRI